jgi:hypothetical protein
MKKKVIVRKGFVLVVALIITLAVGVVAVSLVGLTIQEYRLSKRSAGYSWALHAAESGAGLACEEFARQVLAGGALSGYSVSGDITNATGTVISSYAASAVLSGSDMYIVTSTGRVDLAGATIQRAVRVTVERVESGTQFFKYGAASRGKMVVSGQGLFDSFDSTDTTKSTNGEYDPSLASSGATVASLSTEDPAFSGSGQGEIKGDVSVPSGGAVSTSGQFSITGSSTDDAAQTIVDVTVPFTPTTLIDAPSTISVSGGSAVDYSLKTISLSGRNALTIMGEGTVRIYVDGSIRLSGRSYIQITPSSTTADLNVEIYANDSVSLAGQGVVNDTLSAASFSIWGTDNCTSISMSGQGEFTGTIYAPYADLALNGQGDFVGAFFGDTVTCNGQGSFHVDESLIGGASSSSSSSSGKLYTLVEWVEL